MNCKYLLSLALFSTLACGNIMAGSDTIPLKGNGYITSPDAEETILSYKKMRRPPVARGENERKPSATIDEHNGGIADWCDKSSVISTYFRVEKAGKMELKMVAKGNSTITVTCLGKKKKVKLSSDEPRVYNIGKYDVKKAGHIKVDIQGKKRVEGVTIARVEGGKPVPGTEITYKCDTLLLSTGLIPENELSLSAGVALSRITSGPSVNESFETSVSGIFA